MGLARTNITLPEETLALIDEVAGPRGRSRYIAEVITRQVRRDHARDVFRTYAGALKGSTTWGRTDEEVDAYFRRLRAAWDRPWIWEDPDAVHLGRESAHRPQPRSRRRGRPDRDAVREG